MKIIVLQGSPNKDGSTNILVEEFRRGAEEAGRQSEDPFRSSGRGYDRLCNAALLLWDVRTVKDCDRPVLRVQQQYHEEAYEVSVAGCRVEQRRLDI